jgi:hypothetical protein
MFVQSEDELGLTESAVRLAKKPTRSSAAPVAVIKAVPISGKRVVVPFATVASAPTPENSAMTALKLKEPPPCSVTSTVLAPARQFGEKYISN